MIKAILALKPGEKHFTDCPEETCKRLKLLALQKESYENLFVAYVNKTSEQADNFNLEAFLQANAKVYIAQAATVDDAVSGVVGDLKILHQNGIRYMVNYNAEKMIFFRPQQG
jgi:uncharacterized protein involved in type VI secretion and phage assembly